MHERCGMVSERGLLHMGNAKERIESGKAVLGIEFGSTRIKAVLVTRHISRSRQARTTGRISWSTESGRTAWI